MLQSFQRFNFREHHGVNATGSGQPGHRKADLVRLGTQEQREESQVVGTGVVMFLSLWHSYWPFKTRIFQDLSDFIHARGSIFARAFFIHW
jgi:hypothetical protein